MDQPKFYIFQKKFNGQLKSYEILTPLFTTIEEDKKKNRFYTYEKDSYKKLKITNKKLLSEYLKSYFMYHYWSKCEWEYIIIDWPYDETIDKSNPVKIDAYDQISLNFSLIIDLVWNYLNNKND